MREAGKNVIPGDVLFKLYDTYGFPIDLTADIVESEGFTIDEAGFELCMERQRAQAREHWKGSGEEGIAQVYKELHNSGVRGQFVGYDEMSTYAPVLAIIRDGVPVESAVAGDSVAVITERTPFYGDSGGQKGDSGTHFDRQRPSGCCCRQPPLYRYDCPPRRSQGRGPQNR